MMKIAPQTLQGGCSSACSTEYKREYERRYLTGGKKTFLILIAKDTLKKPPRRTQEKAREGEQMRDIITFRK